MNFLAQYQKLYTFFRTRIENEIKIDMTEVIFVYT